MKYFGLWASLFKISLMAEAEFRLNLLIKVLADVVWYLSQLALFEVLFYHAPVIAGWTIHSMRVFMGLLFFVDCLYMILFHENFDGAASIVRKGELDFMLVKPINSQFMFSLRRASPVYLINMMIVSAYIFWTVWNLQQKPDWWQYPLTFLLLVGGIGVLYSLRFFFAALNVIFTNATSLGYVWYQFYRLGTRPHALYPIWLRWCVLTIFPVALISSVPATNLIQGIDLRLVFSSLAISTLLVFLTTRFWEFVLKRYSSASS